MSIRVLREATGGAAYMVHSSATAGEHFYVARVRQTPDVNVTYCHLCDALTGYPRKNGGAEARVLEDMIVSGAVVPVRMFFAPVGPDSVSEQIDPLVAGREDAIAGVTTPTAARHSIPAKVPQDTEGRRALIAQVREAHRHRSPAGTHYQKWTSDTAFEVRVSDGEGSSTLIETWDSEPEGTLAKRRV